MRLIAAVILLGWFIALVLRRRRWATLLLAGLITAAVAVPEAMWLQREHRYTQVAREAVARDDVRVTCQRTLSSLVDISGNLGYVPYPPDGSAPPAAFLRNDTCGHLADYLDSMRAPTLDQVRAVHVLTHEIQHLAGQRNEALAECEAVQRNHRTAAALGATAAQARGLAATYFREHYPRNTATYSHPGCEPGGKLDENLPDAWWGPTDAPSR